MLLVFSSIFSELVAFISFFLFSYNIFHIFSTSMQSPNVHFTGTNISIKVKNFARDHKTVVIFFCNKRYKS